MSRSRPLLAFALLALVSLLSDMAYESARSVLGPYTRLLEGSMLAAGLIMAGELVAQLSRAAGGALAYRLHSPRTLWGLTFLGYTVNLAAVPALALAGHWWEALALTLVERAGKGLRAPARDVILAETGRKLGTSRLFAIHEVADQAGATAGPLILAWTADRLGIRAGLALTAVPAGLALLALALAWAAYPMPGATPRSGASGSAGLSRGEKLAIAGLGLGLAALPAWPVATYQLSPAEAARLYGLAMLVDAVAAGIVGEAGERLRERSLPLVPLAGALAGVLLWPALERGGPAMVLFAAVWGAAMGIYEVLARAGVAMILEDSRSRSLGYGLLGLASAAGLTLSGLAYAAALSIAGPAAAPAVAVLLALPGLAALYYAVASRGVG